MVGETIKDSVERAFVKRALTQILFLFIPVALGVFSLRLYAAENIVTPPDTNSLVIVENAVVNGNETTVFFLTRPGIRDCTGKAERGDRCRKLEAGSPATTRKP